MFNALVVEKNDEGKTHAAVRQIDIDALPEGDVLVAVDYSTLNYKDGLCIGPGGGLVRTYPHVPGIDFAGTVEASQDPRYAPGDKVVLTGWRVGEVHWGGYAQKARVKADWLVPLPQSISTRDAMAVGTAGLTSMLAVMALEDHGLKGGPVLVTGAAGGVGSVALARCRDTSVAFGSTTAASNLNPAGYSEDDLDNLGIEISGSLSGTWKCLGYSANGIGTTNSLTLWIRTV